MTRPEREITPALIDDALSFIPPDIPHDERVRVAFAVFDGLGTSGADAWKAWAGRRQGASATEDAATWRSVCKGGPVKVGTLFHIAKQYGFKLPKLAADGTTPRAGRPARTADELAAERAARERRDAEEAEALQAEHHEAAQRCRKLWDSASETPPPATGCPYLTRKGVQGHGLRYLRDGTALVPMRDTAGELWSLQRLLPADLVDRESGEVIGNKLYGPPPRKGGKDKVRSRKTGLFHLVGTIGEPALVVLLAEGYATAATLQEATGHPVAVCFDGGNLRHIAQALRAQHPAALLLVCGDDDKPTEARGKGNPGRKAAAAAARAANAGPVRVCFPEPLPEGASDFNDLAAHAGLEAVAALIGKAVQAPAHADAAQPADAGDTSASHPESGPLPWCPDDPGPTGDDGPGPIPGDPGPAASASAGAKPRKPRGKASTGRSASAGDAGAADDTSAGKDWFRLDDDGVWYVPRDSEGNRKKPIWLAAPLHITAISRATDGNGWGFLSEFTDRDGRLKVWAIPAAALGGDGAEWFARLRDMGLRTSTTKGARALLAQYIDSREVRERITSTDRTGWHDGGVFVTPSTTVGPEGAGRLYVFQSESSVEDTLATGGDFDAWRDGVARRCAGNSRLSFVLSCAFAAPLSNALGVATGGFHLQGDSSLGKTTALLTAASVWGPHKFKKQWRQTDNALESVAAQHCDLPLILDEIGQADGRIVGECVYLLGNEMEKGRATRGGLTRKVRTWRLLFLSSGEKSLSDYMREAGRKINEGQEVRMPSITADAGAGLGMLEELHDLDNGRDFSDTLQKVTAAHYGHAGRKWLQHLADHMGDIEGAAGELVNQFETLAVPQYAHPQVWRVARRFALAAAAGELATRAGLTGWEAGEAIEGARRCFSDWLSGRGHSGSGEKVAAVLQVRGWLEKNGDALFTWMHRATDDHRPNTALRAGFKRWVDDKGEPIKRTTADDYCDARASDGSRTVDDEGLSLEYLVLPEQFRTEMCKGLRPDFVAQVLKDAGCLKHERDRLTNSARLPGIGKTKIFHILPSIFSVDVESLES